MELRGAARFRSEIVFEVYQECPHSPYGDLSSGKYLHDTCEIKGPTDHAVRAAQANDKAGVQFLDSPRAAGRGESFVVLVGCTPGAVHMQ
jgi:hypothetical protein